MVPGLVYMESIGQSNLSSVGQSDISIQDRRIVIIGLVVAGPTWDKAAT